MKNIQKLHNEKETIFELVFLISVCVIVHNILTIGQVRVHGDASLPFRYLRSCVEQHTLIPRDWYFVNNELYVFNVTPLAIINSLIIHDLSFARALASAEVFMLSVAGVIYTSKRIFNCSSWKIIVPLIFLLLTGFNARSLIIYEAAYTVQLFAITFVATYYLHIYEQTVSSWKINIRKYLLFAILTFMMGLCGIRFFAELILPLIGAVGLIELARIIGEKDSKIVTFRSAIVVVVRNVIFSMFPALIGYGMFKYIVAHRKMATKAVSDKHFMSIATTFKDVKDNFLGMLDSIALNFSLEEHNILFYIGAIFLIFLLLIIPILQLIKIKKETKEIQFYVAFGIVHNLVFIICALFLGLYDARYLLSSIFICFIISSTYVWKYWLPKKVILNVLFSIAAIVVCVYGVKGLLDESKGWQTKLNRQKEVARIFVEKGLTKGYGTYWNAYQLETYSDNKIKTGAITFEPNNVTQQLWLTDKAVFDDSGSKSFLIIDDTEEEKANVSFLGQPIEEFEVNNVFAYNVYLESYVNKHFRVLVYPYDIGPLFADSYSDSILTAKDIFFNDKVSFEGGVINLHEEGLICGPYSILEAGNYMVTYIGENLDKCKYEIISEGEQDNISYEEEYKDSNKIVVRLKITGVVNGIQFRTYNHQKNGEDIIVQYILVEET